MFEEFYDNLTEIFLFKKSKLVFYPFHFIFLVIFIVSYKGTDLSHIGTNKPSNQHPNLEKHCLRVKEYMNTRMSTVAIFSVKTENSLNAQQVKQRKRTI